MTIYLSIVSHGHDHLIKEMGCVDNFSEQFKIIVKSNKPNENFDYFSDKRNITWINDLYYKGFGENNNIVYQYCIDNLGINNDDYFIVLNPDLYIDSDVIYNLVSKMEDENVSIAAINLYKDEEKKVYDNSIRKFPNLMDFVKSFLGLGNDAVLDKNLIKEKYIVDWAAGSFLAFRSEHYKSLSGFDEGYFMYCEDIDICYRSKNEGEPVVYYPNFTGLHLAKHANRKLFSRHFYWHISSVFRFLLSKSGLVKPKSSIIAK
ncbi:glycosyltransferase family 2 protein [Vibrio olivae]|uniref:Glycosyltransferase family 2 protein n=1 Tax=Vibrio olivae TaxID=1243002 RepID=A0ABV5HQ93_9VIBR